MEIEDAPRRCGGAARWSQLRGFGVSRHALDTAAGTQQIHVTPCGAFTLPGADPATVTAVGLWGVVSHASAARLHGLDLYQPPRVIEVTIGRGCRQRARGVRVYASRLAPKDREINQPITSLRRTVRDCARTMPLLHAVVLLDASSGTTC